MREVTVASTSKVVTFNGIGCRVWEGETERGIKISCFIPRIAVRDDQDLSQFEAELTEHRKPSIEMEAIPLRMIL